ncbi:glycosyltransferase family 2 protein [Bizionia gelidisalsuginis]|uniref:Glycosyltransferase family 2 protein n=1 Tax=Bizionia gelidisalsuginis TaxID=291188 RepID=A0ABY3MDF9_9FLAO|nr:glycosyltransferase family A protein [Bizionia gelidisalsuginis]TYC17010.1 glycosyltransferase family 2 protein [Bizionia gelidisalsuginis]
MKRLAVIMPVYNASQYIDLAIKSTLDQSFKDFDLYIIDDCSIDDSLTKANNYDDSRVFVFKNDKNLGIARTLNEAIKKIYIDYEYIARMDADDYSYPNRFKLQIDFLDQNSTVNLCGTQGYWLKDMQVLPDSNWVYPTRHSDIKFDLMFSACFGHSSVMFRCTVFNDSLFYNESIQTCEDWDLWTRIVLKHKVANLPDFLMKYRIVNTSNHRAENKQEQHFKERSSIISKYLENFDVHLDPNTVFKCYYSVEPLNNIEFQKYLKQIIEMFNSLNKDYLKLMDDNSAKNFRYRFVRFILSFWKRTNLSSRNSLGVWFLVLNEVEFINNYRLLKHLYR